MVTMDILPEGAIHIESIEEALACMEQSIQQKIRKVDICTRYSATQYLIVLFDRMKVRFQWLWIVFLWNIIKNVIGGILFRDMSIDQYWKIKTGMLKNFPDRKIA